MDLHLADLSGAQKRLGGPVDHDRPVTGCGASLTGAVLDIGDETCVAGWHVRDPPLSDSPTGRESHMEDVR